VDQLWPVLRAGAGIMDEIFADQAGDRPSAVAGSEE
jgi:hypothetical protein